MTLLLVRHARAGDRAAWRGDDRLRPLDTRGIRQAEALAPLLAAHGAGTILTSPWLRCVATVEPLARLTGVAPSHSEALGEGSGEAVLSLLPGLAPGTVLCTHGDVIETVVGAGRRKQKGSVWLLDWRDGWLEPASYLPPPA